jgi:hypothetical protein
MRYGFVSVFYFFREHLWDTGFVSVLFFSEHLWDTGLRLYLPMGTHSRWLDDVSTHLESFLQEWLPHVLSV